MTTSEQIIQVFDALCEKFGIVIDWTSDNVIPYITMLCQKLVSYEIWTSVAWIAIMLVLSIVAIVYIATRKTTFYDAFMNDHVGQIVSTIGAAIVILTSIFIIGDQIFDIIKCVTFPELYVFEYIKGLIESSK